MLAAIVATAALADKDTLSWASHAPSWRKLKPCSDLVGYDYHDDHEHDDDALAEELKLLIDVYRKKSD